MRIDVVAVQRGEQCVSLRSELLKAKYRRVRQ